VGSVVCSLRFVENGKRDDVWSREAGVDRTAV
jgi:hypothetical protein